MTRKRGTCVLVGLPPGDFPVPLFGVVADCITIRGSFVGNREDMAETLAIADEGKVRADVELEPLASINSVFDRLKHGAVAGRVVIDYANAAKHRASYRPARSSGSRVSKRHLGCQHMSGSVFARRRACRRSSDRG